MESGSAGTVGETHFIVICLSNTSLTSITFPFRPSRSDPVVHSLFSHGNFVFPFSYLPPLGLHIKKPCIGNLNCSFKRRHSSVGSSLCTSGSMSSTVTNPTDLYKGKPASVASTKASNPSSSALLRPHSIISLPAPRRRCELWVPHHIITKKGGAGE